MRAATVLARLVPGAMLLCAATIAASGDHAARGTALYADRCATCHGRTMQGGDDGLALSGARFARNWSGKPVLALLERIRVTMPQDDPGTLSYDQALDLTAAILSANGVPVAEEKWRGDPGGLRALRIGRAVPASGTAELRP